MRDAAGVRHRASNVIDQLFFDELLAIVDAIEDLTDGKRRGCALPDDPKPLLQLRRSSILEPEPIIGLEFFAKAAKLSKIVLEQMRRNAFGLDKDSNVTYSSRRKLKAEGASAGECSFAVR